MPTSDLRAEYGLTLPQEPKQNMKRMSNIAERNEWQIHDAPGLPVGIAKNNAFPKSVRPKERHDRSITPAALADQQRAKP